MTERLTALMRDEVADLDVPAPPVAQVLAEGRRLHRRSRLTTTLAVAASVALIGGGIAVAGIGDDTRRSLDPAPPAPTTPPPSWVGDAAFGIGSAVWVGDVRATVPGAVHSLHYTSEGVLVRSNRNGGISDGSGPERFTLVRPDGSTADLGTYPEGYGPGTDPGSDVFALAERSGDEVTVVLRDVTTGEVVDRIAVPGDYAALPWRVPPVSLSEGVVYVRTDGVPMAVDLGSGGISEATHIVDQIEVSGGLQATQPHDSGTTAEVVDVRTGEAVRTVEVGRHGYLDFSPDGRFAMIVRPFEGAPPGRTDVVDLADGSTVRLDGEFLDLGWTSDGHLFLVDAFRDTVTTCDADTGSCERQSVDLPSPSAVDSPLRLGGWSYES